MGTWQYLSNDDRDEIERQQRAWERWAQELEAEQMGALDTEKIEEHRRYAQELEAENARLRAALVNIRRDMFALIASDAPDQTTEDAARNTARLASEALAPESADDAT